MRRLRLIGALLFALCGLTFAIAQVTTNPSVSGVLTQTFASVIAALGYTPVNKAGDSMTGPLTQANGSAAAPSYSFSNAASSGFYSAGTYTILISAAGTSTLALNYDSNAEYKMMNSGVVAWSSAANITGSPDSSISRISAGVLGIGNGTQGDFSGSVKMTKLYVDYTNTGTVGAVVINKATGRVNLAAAGTSLVVTDSLVTAASHCFLNADSAPGNVVAVQFYAIPAAGSFSVNAVPAVTNQTAIDFLCINAD